MAALRRPDSCITQPRAVSLTLVTQRLKAGRDDVGRRQAAEVIGEEWGGRLGAGGFLCLCSLAAVNWRAVASR